MSNLSSACILKQLKDNRAAYEAHKKSIAHHDRCVAESLNHNAYYLPPHMHINISKIIQDTIKVFKSNENVMFLKALLPRFDIDDMYKFADRSAKLAFHSDIVYERVAILNEMYVKKQRCAEVKNTDAFIYEETDDPWDGGDATRTAEDAIKEYYSSSEDAIREIHKAPAQPTKNFRRKEFITDFEPESNELVTRMGGWSKHSYFNS